jgi:DNA-binding NarL/FixJ family response regulator
MTTPPPSTLDGARTPLHVVLADDSGIFRHGLAALLAAAGVTVTASVGSVESLVAAVARDQPDIAIVDVRMPPTNTDEGIRAAAHLHRDHPAVGVLVLSTYVEARWVTRLLDAVPEGVGYLLKDRVDDVAALVGVMHRIAVGGIALDPEVVTVLMSARRHAQPLARLTPREREVLTLIAEGQSNTGIADTLVLSVKTVEAHVASIFRALELDATTSYNRRVKAALTFLAAQSGRGGQL